MEDQTIDLHLEQALTHIQKAIMLSIDSVLQNKIPQKDVAHKWEAFIAQFFGYIREKGKENRMNLLSWISFPRLRH